VEALAGNDAREPGFRNDFGRLRPAKTHGILERPVEQEADEQNDDKIQKQRGYDLVDAKTDLEEGGAEQHRSTGENRRCHQHGQKKRRRQRQEAGAQRHSGDGAHIELRLAADVP
jgi:hypothetical protein